MKAVLSRQAGDFSSLILEDIPAPVAGPGKVVVSVKACSINFPDVLMIEDKYQVKPQRPFSPGGEVGGVIKALGEGVTGLKVGDRVIGSMTVGGMAEEALVEAARITRIPDVMPYDEAAALLMTYATSYYALKNRASVKPGETVLVLGAAGGVGLSAVELAKAMGARVVAACSSQEKVDLAKSRGADVGVVYPRDRLDRTAQKALSEAFKAAVGPKGADVIYDGIGGDYAEPALRAIAWEGRFLVIGFAAGEIPKIPLNLALLKSADIRGVFLGAWQNQFPDAARQNNQELLDLYVAGKIKPYVSAHFPLADGARAIAQLADRKALGKVVVTVD